MKFLRSVSVLSVLLALAGASPASAQTCYENQLVPSICTVQVLISDYASEFGSDRADQLGNSAHFGAEVSFNHQVVDESYYVTAQRECMIAQAVPVACAGSGGGGDGGGRNYDNDNDGYADDGSENPGSPM